MSESKNKFNKRNQPEPKGKRTKRGQTKPAPLTPFKSAAESAAVFTGRTLGGPSYSGPSFTNSKFDPAEAAERAAARAAAEAAHRTRVDAVREAYSQADLKRVCEMRESEFAAYYGMQTVTIPQRHEDNEYYFLDNGSNILAVAHLDTVAHHSERTAHFVDTEAGPVIHSRALDDRLGAYTILELLPKLLDAPFDVLLTVGEERGRSTAEFFDAPEGKQYLWGIEFDRANTDVVMYQYDDWDTDALVRAAGATVSTGSFSDISYLSHLEIKCFNWGIGYTGDYHGPRAHAFLNDTFSMVAKFLRFHEQNKDNYLPHDQRDERWGFGGSRGRSSGGGGYGNGRWWDEDEDDKLGAALAKLDNAEPLEIEDEEALIDAGIDPWDDDVDAIIDAQMAADEGDEEVLGVEHEEADPLDSDAVIDHPTQAQVMAVLNAEDAEARKQRAIDMLSSV